MSNIDELIKTLQNQYSNKPEQIKLTQTKKIADFEDADVQKLLTAWYDSKELSLRLLASIINGVVTQGRIVFLFSRPIMDQLLANEPQSKRKTVNYKEYRQCMAEAAAYGCIEKLASGTGSQASVWCLKHEELRKMVAKSNLNNIIAIQTQQAMALFNEYGKTTRKTSRKTSSDNEDDTDDAIEGDSAANKIPSIKRAVERTVPFSNLVSLAPNTGTNSKQPLPESGAATTNPKKSTPETGVVPGTASKDPADEDTHDAPLSLEERVDMTTATWLWVTKEQNKVDVYGGLMGTKRAATVADYVQYMKTCLKDDFRPGIELTSTICEAFDRLVVRKHQVHETPENITMRKEVHASIVGQMPHYFVKRA